MSKKWNILFCDPFMKPCPVSEFLDACRPEHQVKVLHFLELLEEMGPTLLYFFCFETYIIVYRALRKSTSKVPVEYILETRRYREAFLSRMDHDALRRFVDVEL